MQSLNKHEVEDVVYHGNGVAADPSSAQPGSVTAVLCRAAKSMLLQGSKIAVPASCKQRQKRKLNLYLAKRKKKKKKGFSS